MSSLVRIDGSRGEGGGQVLRSSLTLSIATGRPLRIENIRARRSRPGLLRQHLTAVRAAIEISGAEASGAELGSTALEFRPGAVRAGDYAFAVGTAGSTMLVLQTVLLPLALAGGDSTVRLQGGTHNPWSPPFDMLTASFLPQLARIGVDVDARLVRHGFFPAGGGEVEVRVRAAREAKSLELVERGAPSAPFARVLSSRLRASVAREESERLAARLELPEERIAIVEIDDSPGPGNAVLAFLPFQDVTEVVTAFGEKRVSVHAVVASVVDQARAYLRSTAPVGEHLADQLLVPLALLDGGAFRATTVSAHTRTNIDVVHAFGLGSIQLREHSDGTATLVFRR